MLCTCCQVGVAQQIPESIYFVCENPISANCQWTGSTTEVTLTRMDTANAALNKQVNARVLKLDSDQLLSDWIVLADPDTQTQVKDSLSKHYAALFDALQTKLDTVVGKCGSADACNTYIRALRQQEKQKLKGVTTQFMIPGRVKENELLFKNHIKNAIESLISSTGTCASWQEDVRAFKEAYYWKCIANIEMDPTPIANTICVNRTVPVRERFSALDAWARSEISAQPWLYGDTIVLPIKANKRSEDPVAREWKKAVNMMRSGKEARTAIDEQLKLVTQAYRNSSNRLAYRTRKITVKDQKGAVRYQAVALVPERKYNELIYSTKPRHFVLTRRKAQLAIEGGDKKTLIVDRVQFKFEDGAFRQIDVWGQLDSMGTPLHFNNSGVPIPYTHDRQRFREGLDRFPLYSVIARNPKNQRHASIDYILSLSDVFEDMPEFQLRAENIAPGDTVVTFTFPEGNQGSDARSCAQLRKEDTRQLFELKVFTDPLGLAAGKPNGLVQTEISRRVPLAAPKYYVFNLFRYAEPVLRMQLLNQEERSLLLSDTTKDSLRVVPSMGQLNTATWNTGIKLNLITISNPRAQSEYEINALAHLYSTRISDSLLTSTTVTDYNYTAVLDSSGNAVLDSTEVLREGSTRTIRDLGTINSFVYGAELRWRMKPDGRYGFDVYAGAAHYVLLADPAKYQTDLYRFDRFPSVAFAGIDGWFRPSAADKWFFRARWTGDSHKFTNSFVQLQIGYNRQLNFKSK
jgi:hypothetical protein